MFTICFAKLIIIPWPEDWKRSTRKTCWAAWILLAVKCPFICLRKLSLAYARCYWGEGLGFSSVWRGQCSDCAFRWAFIHVEENSQRTQTLTQTLPVLRVNTVFWVVSTSSVCGDEMWNKCKKFNVLFTKKKAFLKSHLHSSQWDACLKHEDYSLNEYSLFCFSSFFAEGLGEHTYFLTEANFSVSPSMSFQ